MITIILKGTGRVDSLMIVDEVLSLLKAHREGVCQVESINLNGYVITDIEGLLNNLIFV